MTDIKLVDFINALAPSELLTLHTINPVMLIYTALFEGVKVINCYDPNNALIYRMLDPASTRKYICRYNTSYQFLSGQAGYLSIT